MASSMLTGDRRGGSARRGGMTVLGKVAVPKPVNLPSQRLENHGLDPNVEIVPKGTLSWGSRSSSSTQNAWGSPSLSSPNTDGGSCSPSRLNGRPSSGGSGTRPSTAGSDRSLEPLPNVWGPNSRPSSASGILASNQTPMATARPRSAETRPGSSQLSRFAEPISGNSVAWGSSGTTERLGASSSKMNEFTLSSGDFPTLGSEKSTESHVLQGHSSHGRPVSASDGVATVKERSGTFSSGDESIIANSDSGDVNSWKKDNSPYAGGGVQPNIEKWQRESQPYSNPNMPPQHFGSSHGTYMHNSPDVVWYQGGSSGGGPCRPPGPPGGYPLESFAYHHPQLPARPLANSQPVPRPGYCPGGYVPNHGDSYRPHMPNSYIQPVIPVRSVVYPSQAPYNGYYGPPCAGLCNSSERDAPIMGMATGPCVYNGYPIQNIHLESGNFHPRPSGYDSTSTAMAKEQGEFGHPHSAHQGPYKVLLKQQDGWAENDGNEKKEHIVSTPNLGRVNLPGAPTRKHEWEAGCTNGLVDFKKSSEEATCQSAESQGGCSSVTVDFNLPESMSQTKAGDDNLVPKPETEAISGEAQQTFLSTKRNPALINKIEGLNNKARISDGRSDTGHAPIREKMKAFRILNAKADHDINEAETGVISTDKASTSRVLSSTQDVSAPAGEKRLAFNETVVSGSVCDLQASTNNIINYSGGGEVAHSDIHKRPHGVNGRANFRGKGRFSTQEGEEWRKKPLVSDSPIVVPHGNVETCPSVCVPDQHAVQEPLEKFNSNIQGKAGGDLSLTSVFDPSDDKRAKMREIAAQRAKELQKEEEERTKEQRAKALAKLQELNRRTQAESSTKEEEQTAEQSTKALAKLQGLNRRTLAESSTKKEEVQTREQRTNALANLEELNRQTLPESSTKKVDHSLPQSGALQHKQEDSQSNAGPMSYVTCSSGVPNLNSITVTRMDDTNRLGESTDLPKSLPSEVSLCAPPDHVVTNSTFPLHEAVDATDQRTAQVNDISVPKQKQMGYKRKQNSSMDKNLNENSIPTANVGGPKSHDNAVISLNALSDESNLPGKTNATENPSQQHKRKNIKSGKNKHKFDEVSSGMLLSSLVPIEGTTVKASVESIKPKTPETVLEVITVQTKTSHNVVPSTDLGWSPPTEEAHSRANNQGKSQPSRRMPRKPQVARAMDKFHGSDNVVWAPVRSQNKNDVLEESSINTTIEVHSPKAIGHVTQNNQKSRRAEMERYVPKPVAKELSQQGNMQQPSSPSVNQSMSEETTETAKSGSLITESIEPDDLAVGKGSFSVVPIDEESNDNKHGKTRGWWRQRGSWTNRQAKYSDIRNTPNNNLSNEQITVPDVKDHGVTGRGKRQTFKGGTYSNPNNSDHESHGEDTLKSGIRSPANKLSQLDRKTALGENHGLGQHASSHWQPKSQPYLPNNHQGSRANGSERVISQVGKVPEKEYPPPGGEKLALRNDYILPNQSDMQKDVAGVPNRHHQDVKGERKGIDSSKEGAPSPSQGPVKIPGLALPENEDIQHEQSFSSGLRRHGHHNARFGRGHEVPRGGRGSPGQDNSKPHHVPANTDKRRNGSHYEYQPAGSSNKDCSESFEGDSHNTGSRYRERGLTHSRRGGANFYGRGSGTLRMAAAYASIE